MSNLVPRWNIKIPIMLVALAVSGCDRFARCKDTITYGGISPDGRYAAVVYHRDCGAPGVAATYVEIRSSLSKFKGGGKDPVFAVEWTVPIGVFWTDNSNLRIQSIGCPTDKVFRQEKAWRDVTISYEVYGQIATDYR